MYFYVISEDSTRFLPTAACAGHQLQVPAGDFPLICTLSSTPVQRNQSSIVNAAFRLAAVKNLPGYAVQVGCGPYISSCSCQNHQFEPCFGVANQVSPLLRFESRTSTAMTDKADPVVEIVEEEEEEWPEAGAQNVAEAEQYQDKINNVFETLSILIHQDTKTALSDTIQNFKKIITKQWDSMGAADTDVVLRTIKDLTALYLHQHLTAGGIEVVDPPEEIPSGEEFLCKLPKQTQTGGRDGLYYRHLRTCGPSAPTSVGSVHKCSSTGQNNRQDDIDDGHKWCGAAPGTVKHP